MNKVQKFALENIYCAPGQDQQFSFSLVRVNNVNQPLINKVAVYSVVKNLPNPNYRYHVFIIGNLNPNFLNLLRQGRDWFKDAWVKVSDDMVARNYIFKMYNEEGVMYPKQHLYYSFIDESSIILAMEFDHSLKLKFDINSFKYVHVYSNSYFDGSEFNSLPVKLGIKYNFDFVFSNVNKVALQNQIATYESSGGKAIVYVNGYYTDNLNLNIPDNSYIEIVYDQSIISKEKYVINNLRTFDSTKDNKLKYLIFRNNLIDYIQFKDDNEIYVSNDNELVTKGLFFYQHQDYAVRNVTDKDYSLYTAFINTTAQNVTNITSGALQDKTIVLFTRKAGMIKDLIYSSLKLNELYKLPQNVEHDVLSNMNYTINELRAETLEDSDYFKISNMSGVKNVSKELAVSALGYNGISYYFAYSPLEVNIANENLQVPTLYQEDSLAFEYGVNGKYTGTFNTSGPVYPVADSNTRYVEFLYGRTPLDYGRLYNNDEVVTLLHNEFRVISAYFSGINRLTNWVDITNDATKCLVANGLLTLSEQNNYKVKIVYFNQPNVYNIQLELTDAVLYFPLTINEDRGTGVNLFPIDVPYRNIEIYLNGNKLTYKLGYTINFPNVCIVDKKYLDYTKQYQDIHIRMYGFTLDKDEINKLETTGFVNHSVLARNNKFDIREDRVISVYIDGKMYNRNNVIFAEDDNTIRITHPLNGLPYTIKEPFIPLKTISETDTFEIFNNNVDANKRISDLFDIVFPEPDVDQFNAIIDHYYVYSPTVSKIIFDMIDGNIAQSLYQTPYDDQTILTLLDQAPYKELLILDPIKNGLPYETNQLVEVHPSIGNTTVNLNLFQYRFITNVIRIITNNNPNQINISGYLTVTT